MDNKLPKMIFIKMEKCLHCIAFQDIWDNLELEADLVGKVKFEQYDMNDNYPNEYREYTSNGYPTIILKTNNNIIPYNKKRVVNDIKKFIFENTTNNNQNPIANIGGGKNDEDYKIKYLKYKAKYLKLKSMQL